MAKTLRCRDVGVDCDFVAKGETEDEIMEQAARHAREEHGFEQIPPDLEQKARSAIKDEGAARA